MERKVVGKKEMGWKQKEVLSLERKLGGSGGFTILIVGVWYLGLRPLFLRRWLLHTACNILYSGVIIPRGCYEL